MPLQEETSNIIMEGVCPKRKLSNGDEPQVIKAPKVDEITIKSSATSIEVDVHGEGVADDVMSPLTELLNGNSILPNSPSTSTKENDTSQDNQEITEKEKRNAARIKMLEKHLKKLKKRVDKLQQKELTYDDMDDSDSPYIMEERYHKKIIQVYKKICELKKCSSKTGRQMEKSFHYSGTRYTKINERVERLINKQKQFPDFADINDIVKIANEDEGLSLSSPRIQCIAEEIFRDIGKELKGRRVSDFKECLLSYAITNDKPIDEFIEESLTKDPAESDEVLRQTLNKNAVDGENKIQDIIDDYAVKQQEKCKPSSGDDDDDATTDSDASVEQNDKSETIKNGINDGSKAKDSSCEEVIQISSDSDDC